MKLAPLLALACCAVGLPARCAWSWQTSVGGAFVPIALTVDGQGDVVTVGGPTFAQTLSIAKLSGETGTVLWRTDLRADDVFIAMHLVGVDSHQNVVAVGEAFKYSS